MAARIPCSLGELAITDSVTIQGPGSTKLTINAGGNSRIFDVNDNNAATNINVEIDGLTLTGGGNVNDGGAIDSCENLAVNDLNIVGNNALQAGGGIFAYVAGTDDDPEQHPFRELCRRRREDLRHYRGRRRDDDRNSTISGNTASMGGGIDCATWRLRR